MAVVKVTVTFGRSATLNQFNDFDALCMPPLSGAQYVPCHS